jgi:hypothetical protein
VRWSRRTPATSRTDDSVPARARAAFRAGLTDSVVDLTRVGDLYVDWADTYGTVAQQAEAYWMRSVVTARAAMHGGLPASQLAVLAHSQHIAAEAGYWLAADDRLTDAVTAVEHSRAILLTRLAGSLEPHVRQRLASGHAKLLEEYLDALRRRADAYRDQYSGASTPIAPIIRGQRSYQSGSASALEAAQSELARLARQISTVAGPLDPLEVPRYETIREAARQAPIVYVAAAQRAGYALIVGRVGEPVYVPLPELRSEAVLGRAKAFTAKALIPRAVRDCVDWLAAAISEIASKIPGEAEIAVITLGALNLLPLNAAFIQGTADRQGGPLTVRFLPNARVVADAPRWPGEGLTSRMLVVDGTRVPGALLPRSGREAESLVRRYRARRLDDATSRAVLPAMDTAALVHFLCHGRANLSDPLLSGLLLADGLLTVRTLLARPPLQRQLVVLSACESHLGGTAAPDEIIGLPAALFQAGALGVIAAQWKVEELPALLVLRKFYEQLDGGARPAQALTVAQNWLRTATRGNLTSAYPDLFTEVRASDPAMTVKRDAQIPYDGPVDWAAFSYTGI